MNSNQGEEIYFGVNSKGEQVKGTLNQLEIPKDYHYTDATYKQAKRCQSIASVGDRKMILADVQRIKNGEARHETIDEKRRGEIKGKTTRFRLDNGRTYRLGYSGRMFPEKGPGITVLSKRQTRALGVLNSHGLSVKSQNTLARLNVQKKDVNAALGVWKQNKGRVVNPKHVKDWQTGFEKRFPKNVEPKRRGTANESLSKSPTKTQLQSTRANAETQTRTPPPQQTPKRSR